MKRTDCLNGKKESRYWFSLPEFNLRCGHFRRKVTFGSTALSLNGRYIYNYILYGKRVYPPRIISRLNIMNKRTISSLNFSGIPAGRLILVAAVATGSATGKMVAVPSLSTQDAHSAGNSPAMPFHPRHTSRNKNLTEGG